MSLGLNIKINSLPHKELETLWNTPLYTLHVIAGLFKTRLKKLLNQTERRSIPNMYECMRKTKGMKLIQTKTICRKLYSPFLLAIYRDEHKK